MDGQILYYFLFTFFSIIPLRKIGNGEYYKIGGFKIENDTISIFILFFVSLIGFMVNSIFNIDAIVLWLAMTLMFTILLTRPTALIRAYCIAVVVESIILHINGYVYYRDNIKFLLFIFSIVIFSYFFIRAWDKLKFTKGVTH